MLYMKGRYVKIKRKQDEYETEERRIDKDKYERGENRRRRKGFLTLKEWREEKSHTKRQRGSERSRQERREEANSSNKFEEEDSRR